MSSMSRRRFLGTVGAGLVAGALGGRWPVRRAGAWSRGPESPNFLFVLVDDLGFDKDTVIVFFSDNGGLHSVTSNYPLRRGKGYYYEAGIRVPLIVKWPGATVAASQCDWPVISNDFYPTFLEMAGLPLMPQQHLDDWLTQMDAYIPVHKGATRG